MDRASAQSTQARPRARGPRQDRSLEGEPLGRASRLAEALGRDLTGVAPLLEVSGVPLPCLFTGQPEVYILGPGFGEGADRGLCQRETYVLC